KEKKSPNEHSLLSRCATNKEQSQSHCSNHPNKQARPHGPHETESEELERGIKVDVRRILRCVRKSPEPELLEDARLQQNQTGQHKRQSSTGTVGSNSRPQTSPIDCVFPLENEQINSSKKNKNA